ncbi:hypothetical protein Pla108_08370 [Botrimarina colliarenosi]|uniref:HEAT repeat protein n=1 Tax=Botrimarina colliarenosi TaxID=2528001 RepID=A0A5C6AIQ4_9BACT|nr:hypothetical protein [Botrimarina colliarenosi]TWT99894.1 hypothetical protein Pla108_08370 [Botrimarina colliarenosi]
MRYLCDTTVARWLLCLTVIALAAPASAQRYKSDAVESRLSSKGAIARRYAKSGTGDAQEFKEYVEKYFFPAMTQPTAEGLADLEKLHGDLFKYYLYTSTGETQKYMNQQAMEFAVRVLRASYHPSVRYNALLILGKLDDKYADPPTPSAKACDLLCSLASRALKNARVPNYELVGALIGLERHAKYVRVLPSDQQKALAKTLYDVMSVDKLEGEFTPEVREWVFVSAASAIANLGTPGPRGVFAAALTKRIGDESLSLESRATIAAALEKLNAKAGQFDGEPVVNAVIDLAAEIGKEEAEIANKFEDLQLQVGGGFIGARGKLSRRIVQNAEREPTIVREALLALLVDLRDGVRAAKAISPEPKQAAVATIDDAVSNAIRVVSDKGKIDLDVSEAIKDMAEAIQGVANTEPLAAAE